jgi:ribonuclease P protein subunit POP4
MNSKGHDRNRNILMLELIGARLRVVQHTDPGLSDREGIVLDETMKTFLIDEDGKRTIVPKKGGRFSLASMKSGGQPILVDGSDIQFRPEDRNKKMERKRSRIKRGKS